MSWRSALRHARETGDINELVDAIPYARFMGISMMVADGDVVGKLAFSPHLIGNAALPALHGGTIGALLESTAVFKLLWAAQSDLVPKTINITIQYLRSGKAEDMFASAVFVRHGRSIANVRATAWQDDPDRPIAAATMHFLLGPTPCAPSPA